MNKNGVASRRNQCSWPVVFKPHPYKCLVALLMIQTRLYFKQFQKIQKNLTFIDALILLGGLLSNLTASDPIWVILDKNCHMTGLKYSMLIFTHL